jgi:hypothetical protein
MITTIVIGAIVLWAVVSLSKRLGFRTVMDVATMLFLAAPVVWFAAIIVSPLLHRMKSPGVTTWIEVGLVVGVALWLTVKHLGLGTVLGSMFTIAMVGCFVIIAAFTFLVAMSSGSAHGGH